MAPWGITHPRRSTRRLGGSIAGYAAFVWGVVFAAISFYWGTGGSRGVVIVWGASSATAEHSTLLRAAVGTNGFLVTALLALALVSEWVGYFLGDQLRYSAGRPL